jgi:hypothetical protein
VKAWPRLPSWPRCLGGLGAFEAAGAATGTFTDDWLTPTLVLHMGHMRLGTDAVSPPSAGPQRRNDCCWEGPPSETGCGDGPHPLHAVSAIRETDDRSRDAGRDEPEDRAANDRDAPTIAAFHVENRSPLAALAHLVSFRDRRWAIGRPTLARAAGNTRRTAPLPSRRGSPRH